MIGAFQAGVMATTRLGPELIPSPGFDNSSGWELASGWSISGGKLRASAALVETYCRIAVQTNVNKRYRLIATVDSINSGARLEFDTGNTLWMTFFNAYNAGVVGADKTKALTEAYLYIFAKNITTTAVIDNLSLREVLS